MIKSGLASRPATIGAKIQSVVRLKWFFSLAIAVLMTVAATPPPNQQTPDEQYIQIMSLIDRADALQAAGKTDAAKAKYKDAERALLYFKAANPLFAPRTVAYRLKEVTEKADTRPPITEPTPSASAEKPKSNLEAPAAASKSGVKLIDAGAEPRSVLRYHPKAGDKQLAIMTVKITVDMSMPAAAPGGGAAPQIPVIPAITIPMDTTVQSVAANGDITFESVMGDAGFKEEPGMDPQMVQGLKTQLAGLKGVTTTGVISSRGISKKLDVKTTGNADPQARQMMDQIKEGTGNINVPFPDEPVGVGAKWEMNKMTKVQAASVEQTGTYELTAMEGDHLTAKLNVGFKATNSAPQAAAAANAAQMGGNATGTANLDLSKLVGSSVTLDMHMEMPMGKMGTMKMGMNMSVEAQ